MILSTFTLLKTPFSLINPTQATKSIADFFNEYFKVGELDWEYGYGDLSRDNIPKALQPKFVLKFNNILSDLLNHVSQEYNLEIYDAKLCLFEHNVAVIMLDFNVNDNELINRIDFNFDAKISQCLESIAIQTIQPAVEVLALNRKLAQSVGITLDSNLQSRMSEQSDLVLWTARYLFLGPEYKDHSNLLKWCSLEQHKIVSSHELEFYIGSGNGVIFSNTPLIYLNDVKKTILLPQFYYAFLSHYSDFFESALDRFKRLNEKIFSPKRKIDLLLNQTLERIENQEYLSLAIADAIRGTQGLRAPLLQQIIENWQLKALEQDTSKKTTFLHQKLDTWMNKIIQKQNRTIEVVLSLMGGIALIDFILNLLVSAPELKDRTMSSYSIINLFSQTTADSAIYLSSGLLLFALIYIYFKRK